MANAKAVLITGASTGIGRTTAQLFQDKGWNVAATMRSPEAGKDLQTLDNGWNRQATVSGRGSRDPDAGAAQSEERRTQIRRMREMFGL